MRPSDFAIVSFGVLLNAFAQLGMKAATERAGPMQLNRADALGQLVAVFMTPAMWAALAAYALSVVVWVIGLSRVPVGQAYPLLSMGYAINLGLAWWLLGEVPNVQRVVGVGVIICGVVLVARS